GQVYVALEAPRGELGVHAVSDGGTRPYRVHYREPSFINLQAIPAMAEGGLLADVIAGGASLDPVMGGCDRAWSFPKKRTTRPRRSSPGTPRGTRVRRCCPFCTSCKP